MGMLDDMIVNAKSTANAVGKKASQLVDISKLRINAADLGAEISKKFEQLGHAVYDAHKSGSDAGQAVAEASAEIDELEEQLEAVNSQLAAAHEKKVCHFCGQENAQEATYCSRCGRKLSNDKAEDVPFPKDDDASKK